MDWSVYVCTSLGTNNFEYSLRRFCDIKARSAEEAMAVSNRLIDLCGVSAFGTNIYRTNNNSHFEILRARAVALRNKSWISYGNHRNRSSDSSSIKPESRRIDLDSYEGEYEHFKFKGILRVDEV